MIDPNDVHQKTTYLCKLARIKFGVTADTFDVAMRKIGRRAPSRVHRAAGVILRAQEMSGNPKLMRRLDPVKVENALIEVQDFLTHVDPKDRRKGVILGVLGSIVFNLILVFILLVLVLRWRGYL